MDDACTLRAWSTQNQLPFHIHVEEQPKEIEDCCSSAVSESHGKRPLELVVGRMMDSAPSSSVVTAVHCTFSARSNLDAFFERGGIVCVCPTTEGP